MPLVLHFLNVGHGDCTFIEHPSGRLMMVDINNSKSLPSDDIDALAEQVGLSRLAFRYAAPGTRSWEQHYQSLLVDPYEYYKEKFEGRRVFRYIQTHPDMDHMGGLHRFFWQEQVPLDNFWDVQHNKELTEESFSSSPYSFADWCTYRILRLGVGPGDAQGNEATHQVMNLLRNAEGQYWQEDGIEIMSPTAHLVEICNESGSYNNLSFVLKVSYAGRSVILPGDAEGASWDSMISVYSKEDLKCDILKASHHGRKSGYHEEAVGIMNPSVVVCSVGKKPSTDASADYARHAEKVLSTRFNGNLKVTIWHDGDIWIDDYKGDRIHEITA
ncbi:ComEC/Rec2 family competence protein [Streptomyces griseus]|uniref:ComEC/Rec2 family competence protein n=1 Tax=Streptomyces griseus TaxID=1911 RepID=UPI00367B4220